MKVIHEYGIELGLFELSVYTDVQREFDVTDPNMTVHNQRNPEYAIKDRVVRPTCHKCSDSEGH